MTNVIKQIVTGEGDSQTIRMVVKDSERGRDGVIQYTAGRGIKIKDNVISAVGGGGGGGEWGYIEGEIEDQQDLMQEFAKYTPTSNLASVATSGSYYDLSYTPELATVATTGLYSDLSGTPSLATVATTGLYSDLSGTPTLATVATSGSYADLSNKPTVPVITMTTTDPGEGTPLAANNFIAVYEP